MRFNQKLYIGWKLSIIQMIVKKTISIKDVHEAWIEENSINLSRFVQKRIDERMYNDGDQR